MFPVFSLRDPSGRFNPNVFCAPRSLIAAIARRLPRRIGYVENARLGHNVDYWIVAARPYRYYK